jgi:hypothetical protein
LLFLTTLILVTVQWEELTDFSVFLYFWVLDDKIDARGQTCTITET